MGENYSPMHFQCAHGHWTDSDRYLTTCPHGTCGLPVDRVGIDGRVLSKAGAR